jgi:hypothetical protein
MSNAQATHTRAIQKQKPLFRQLSFTNKLDLITCNMQEVSMRRQRSWTLRLVNMCLLLLFFQSLCLAIPLVYWDIVKYPFVVVIHGNSQGSLSPILTNNKLVQKLVDLLGGGRGLFVVTSGLT